MRTKEQKTINIQFLYVFIQLSRYNSLTLRVTDKDINFNLLSFSWSVSFIVLWLLVGRKVLKNGLESEKEFIVFFSLMPNIFFAK